MGFIDELVGLMPDTLIAQPGSMSGFGGWTASGTALSLACRISGGTKLVRDTSGAEVSSSVHVVVGSVNGLDTTGYRYTLPSDFSPNVELTAIAARAVRDEDGPAYEVLDFP